MVTEKIRVSIGSAAVLGLEVSLKPKDPPTTCYLMTYIKGHCSANCGFCPQARSSNSSTENLSRVNWPIFSIIDVVNKLKGLPVENNFKRICIQTFNYPNNFQDIVEIVRQIRVEYKGPISVAIPPMSKEQLKELKSIGVSKIGIALDGSTPEIFDNVKGKKINGPYKWEEHFQSLKTALDVFTKGYVSTHLIVGLGETHEEILKRLEDLHKLTITVSLFAFTPVKGTKFEIMSQPEIIDFRKIQLGRHLIVNNLKSINDYTFNKEGNVIKFDISKDELRDIVENSNAFMTSGCTGCNRPYYTSKPSGPIYNYPRTLFIEEKEEIYNLMQEYVN